MSRAVTNSRAGLHTGALRQNSVSPNKSQREVANLNSLSQRRQSAAIVPSEHLNKIEVEPVELEVEDDISDNSSILSKMKSKRNEISKRQGFMKMIKLESGVSEIDRSTLIMTPQQNPTPLDVLRTAELD